MLHVGLL